MIAYNKYTLQQIFDELIIRLGNHRSAENLDWYTTILYINQAFEEAMMQTMPLKEWAFTTTYPVQHLDRLPLNFIAPIRVMLSETGDSPYIEARKVDVREWFTIQNANIMQKWNRSTYNNPTFMIWGQRIYLHPTSTWDLSVTTNVSGFMDCYQIPNRIFLPTDTLRLPFEFEELIMLLALERIVSRTVDNELLMELSKSVQQERNKVVEQYMKRKHVEKRELESFVEPVTPLVPPPPVVGELPNRLV